MNRVPAHMVVLLLVLLLMAQAVFSQALVVNEFLASNSNTNFDEDGDSSDWLELYNGSGDAIDLDGYGVSDNATNPAKWLLPAVTIPDGGYLLIWASGKNRTGNQLHTNFKLSASGETVGLFKPNGDLVDGFAFGAQSQDVSMARIPNGSGDFEPTAQPTPGQANEQEVPPANVLNLSPPSGFFDGAVDVDLSSNIGGVTIRYTTNGSAVTSSSTTFSGSIHISSTKVLRARAYDGSTPVSDDISQIYMIDYNGSLPVLSYATDESNLFGSTGIFDNPDQSGSQWERPVSVNMLELDGSGFQINAGMRTHGGRSRRQDFPKLSTRLYFRSDYGPTKLRYRLFDSKNIDVFDRLVIHAGGSSDQFFKKVGKINTEWSLIRDPLNHSLWHEENGVVSAFRPVVLYINGDLWGIYHIRERIDDFYLESNYEILDADLLRPNDDKITLEAGDQSAWDSMFSFIENHDMSSSGNYQQAQDLINIDNFIDFFVFNIFIGNWDMPHTNIYMFRERLSGGKWHYVMWDTDVSFGSLGNALPASDNTLVWATRDEVIPDCCGGLDGEELLWSTLILRKLLDNDDFRKRYVNRFADMMNTTLHPDHIKEVADAMADVLRPNIEFETDTWDGANVSDWENGIDTIKNWAAARPAHQRNHLRNMFGLGSDRQLTLTIDGAGKIRVNTITPDSYPWSGAYFDKIPVELEAIPDPGYRFSTWSGVPVPDNPVVELDLNNDKTVTAHFEVDDTEPACVHDGDINGDAALTPGDALCAMDIFLNGQNLPSSCDEDNFDCELIAADVNCNDEVTPGDALAIFQRFLNNGLPQDCFAEGASANMAAKENTYHLTLSPQAVSDISEQKNILSVALIVDRTEGLSAFGLTLNFPADRLRFVGIERTGLTAEWMAMDGKGNASGRVTVGGFTDRPVAANKEAALAHLLFERIDGGRPGTPVFGVLNLTDDFAGAQWRVKSAAGASETIPGSFNLYQNYPNPFNPETRIRFDIPGESGRVKAHIAIYNVSGQLVRVLLDEERVPGSYEIVWDSRNQKGIQLPSGMYVFKIIADQFEETKRMLLVR